MGQMSTEGVGGSTWRLLDGLAVADRVVAASFDDVYRSSWLPMLRLATLLMGSRAEAEDVVQSAFVNLYRRWDTIADSVTLNAYIRATVVNGSRSAMRRRSITTRAQPWRSSDVDLVPESSEHGDVFHALHQLPRRQREVLVLRYWSDLSEEDTAKTLAISRGTVKSTASRALSALQRRLDATHD